MLNINNLDKFVKLVPENLPGIYFQGVFTHQILVFFLSVAFALLVLTVFFMFIHNNILLTYMLCEFVVILVVFILLWNPMFSYSIKIQTMVLLFLGLIAAELALGLILFIKYYRVTRNMDWQGE